MSLFFIGFTSLIVRLYYFPFGIPIRLDGLLYFWYANDTSILGHFPTNYYVENNGWPAFLSIFFSIFHFNNFLDYTTLQRLVTISLSVLTIIPVYLLCNRYLEKPYSLIGAIVFAFEPRLIQNSLLGITEPLYILLVTSALVLFLNSNKKLMYASFGITALSTLVRSEGLFLFLTLSILFFIRYRKENRAIFKYIIALCIFILVMLPMTFIRLENVGQDSVTSKIPRAVNEIISSSSNHGGLITFLIDGIVRSIKFLGWDLIPIFIFLVPVGYFFILKKRDYISLTITLSTIIMILPSFFAYLNNSDTRFFFILYPLFCVTSVVTIKKISIKFKRQNVVLILFIVGILVVSNIFLDYKKIDYEQEREQFSIAKLVVNTIKGTDSSSKASEYFKVAEIAEKWPNLPSITYNGNIQTTISIFSPFDSTSLKEFIKKSEPSGLMYLTLDGNEKSPDFLNDVFYHEEKYPYLTKMYDSLDHGYKYHLKIYKINYNKFNSLTESN